MTILAQDLNRARNLAQILYEAFCVNGKGILGNYDMPEDLLPRQIKPGSREHALFITLTVSIDYTRDSTSLWKAARTCCESPDLTYLFEPEAVCHAGLSKLESDMKRLGLSQKHKRDARFWYTIAKTFFTKWDGNPLFFLEDCKFHAPKIVERLNSDLHKNDNRFLPDFPNLRGPKISCLWIRMLRDNIGLKLTGMDEIPIPVDVHILRATLCSGVLKGSYRGSIEPIKQEVCEVWKEVTKDIFLPEKQRAMMALDIDEPLWHLSRSGCATRGNGPLSACRKICPCFPGCSSGIVRIQNSHIEIET